MKKHILSAAIAASLGVVAYAPAHAATGVLNNGDSFTIAAGTGTTTTHLTGSASSNTHTVSVTHVKGGSWFGMMTTSGLAKTELDQGTQGLIIGQAQAPGGDCTNGVCSYSGAPVAGDTSNINAPWLFYGNTGKNYTTVAVTGGTATGLNFSGWQVTWNGIADIPMTGGAWGTGFTSGVANFKWDGVYGDSYTLNYHATVPAGSPSGFGGVEYALHLTGTVQPAAVPIPAAAWLFGSGLIGLVGIARRKKSA